MPKREFIRRTRKRPEFVEDELLHARHYPKRIDFPEFNASVRCRTSRLEWVGECKGVIARVKCFCWLMMAGERIGAFELVSFDPVGCFDNDGFLEVMDFDAASEHQLSVVLCDSWEDLIPDVADYGSILDFALAWIDPSHTHSGLFGAAANGVIEHVFPDHAVLIIHAFPIEYTGIITNRSRARAVHTRQKAMYRYYKRLFNVRRLPGKHGRKFWLWRPHPRLAGIIRTSRRHASGRD